MTSKKVRRTTALTLKNAKSATADNRAKAPGQGRRGGSDSANLYRAGKRENVYSVRKSDVRDEDIQWRGGKELQSVERRKETEAINRRRSTGAWGEGRRWEVGRPRDFL